MNSTQVKSILTPLIGLAAVWLASKFPLLDPATWNTLVSTVVFTVVGIVLTVLTGKNQLADSLAAYPDTKVVTDRATAAATSSPDVVSNTDVKVVPK